MTLLSRGRFERRLAELLARMLTSQEHSLLYLSVDNPALKKPVVRTTLSMLKSGELMAALGDGEFVLLLPDCSEARALQTARLLRIALRRLRFNRTKNVNIRFGIGIVIINWTQNDPAAILDSARRASQKAIARGNDGIVTAF